MSSPHYTSRLWRIWATDVTSTTIDLPSAPPSSHAAAYLFSSSIVAFFCLPEASYLRLSFVSYLLPRRRTQIQFRSCAHNMYARLFVRSSTSMRCFFPKRRDDRPRLFSEPLTAVFQFNSVLSFDVIVPVISCYCTSE